MTDNMKPELGDTVEFSAVGKYGAVDNATGTVETVYKNGSVKIVSEYGTFRLKSYEVLVLSRAA